MRPSVLAAGFAALVSAGALLATAAASPAQALDPSAVQTIVVSGPSAAVLPLQVDRLYPGVGTHARFVVRRGSSESGATFAAAVTDVEDLERGCNRPEQNAGDVTCAAGSDQGELSEQLLVNADWTSDAAGCATAPLPSVGTSMARGTAFLAPAALASGDACLVLALHLPIEADNLVQSDLVRFSLRIGPETAVLGGIPAPAAALHAQAGTPTTTELLPSSSPIAGADEQAAEAAPTTISAPNSSAVPPVAALAPQSRALPFTGGQPLLLLGWGALLVFAGHVLVRAARQRGRLT